jgi:hypothetical protein
VNDPIYLSIYFARMAELEEGTGTEASDSELLEQFYSHDSEDCTRWAVVFFYITTGPLS